MWLCVDRIEGDLVVLVSDGRECYHLVVERYAALVGRLPQEADILSATIVDGEVLAASYDAVETQLRRAALEDRLQRLRRPRF